MKLLLIEAHLFGYRGLQSLINIFDESSFSFYDRAAAAAELRDINKQNTEKLLSVPKAAPHHRCLRHLRGSSTTAFSLVCADRHQHLNIIIIAHRLELLDSMLFRVLDSAKKLEFVGRTRSGWVKRWKSPEPCVINSLALPSLLCLFN